MCAVKAEEEEWQLDDSPVAKSLIPHGWMDLLMRIQENLFMQSTITSFYIETIERW